MSEPKIKMEEEILARILPFLEDFSKWEYLGSLYPYASLYPCVGIRSTNICIVENDVFSRSFTIYVDKEGPNEYRHVITDKESCKKFSTLFRFLAEEDRKTKNKMFLRALDQNLHHHSNERDSCHST